MSTARTARRTGDAAPDTDEVTAKDADTSDPKTSDGKAAAEQTEPSSAPDVEADERSDGAEGELSDPDGDIDSASDDEPGDADTESGDDDRDVEEATDSEDSKRDEPTTRAPRWQRIPAYALVVLVVAGAITAGMWWRTSIENSRTETRNAEAIEKAREVVLALTTLRHDDLKKSVDSILSETTGAFRNQFADSTSAFTTALTEGKVDSTGRIDSAGLIRGDGETAEVLVAASSTVKNSQAPDGDPRVYRMRVSLQHDADKWLVSNVEFVP